MASVGQGSDHGYNYGYNTLEKCSTKVCEGLSRDPLNIAESLLGKGIISSALMEEVRTLPGTRMEKGNMLYTALLECVKAYRTRYSDFISVLEENKVLHSDLLTALRNTHLKICNVALKEKIENTDKVIKTVVSIAKELEMSTHSQELERISSALLSGKVKIGLAGLTNAGKSTTANSFIGSPFLPSSFQRQTVSSIQIVHDPKCPNGELFGRKQPSDNLVPLASGVEPVNSFLAKLNTDDRKGEIQYTELILKAPVAMLSEIEQTFTPEIIDMPGTSETFTSQKTTAAARTALKRLAAIILVVGADDVSKNELTKLVDGIKNSHPGLVEKQNRILVLINKYDLCYDKKNSSYSPEKLQEDIAEQIGISIKQTVCFSAKYAQEAQQWLRDPSAVNKDMYGEMYFALRKTPEHDSIVFLEKHTQENVKKLAKVLEKVSRFSEVKTKLLSALCDNGPEIILDSAVDDCRGEMSKIEEAITQKVEELGVQEKENSAEKQRAQVERVGHFFEETGKFKISFPERVVQSFDFPLKVVASKLENDISTHAFSKVVNLKREYNDEKYVLLCVQATQQAMLESAKDKVNDSWIFGIAQMKETLSINFRSMLKGLQQDLVIHKLTDLLDFNGVDPNKLLDTLAFPSVEQPKFAECTAISDEAIKPAIRHSTKTVYKNETATKEIRYLIFFTTTFNYDTMVDSQQKVFEIDFDTLSTAFKQLALFCSSHVQNSLLKILKDVASKLSQALWCELQKLSKEPIQLKKNELEAVEQDLQISKKEITKFENKCQALVDADRKLCDSLSLAGKKRTHEEASSSIKKPDFSDGESSVTELRSEMKRQLLKCESLEANLDQLTDEYDEQVNINHQLEKDNEHLRNENHYLRAENKGLVPVKQELKVEPEHSSQLPLITGEKREAIKCIKQDSSNKRPRIDDASEDTFTLMHIKQETKAEPQTTEVKSEESVSQLLPLGLSTVQHHAIPFDLPGVDVVASTCVIVTNLPQTFHWVDYGFKLIIPQGCLPAGVDQCRLNIKASVAGHYQFPDNLQLVSGVFWVHPYPLCRFQQQLTVEIQHCAKMTSSTKLSFVRAHCSQESLPYTFKQLEGHGSFTEHNSYGCLSVNHFSSHAIVAEGDVDILCIASLYYLKADPRTMEIHFTINMDDEIHNTERQKHFKCLGATEKLTMELEFNDSNVALDIPLPSGVKVDEWSLVPLVPPMISKKRVLSFKPGRAIPSTKLLATLPESRDCKVPRRLRLTTLKGAKKPHNQMTIVFDPVDPKEGNSVTPLATPHTTTQSAGSTSAPAGADLVPFEVDGRSPFYIASDFEPDPESQESLPVLESEIPLCDLVSLASYFDDVDLLVALLPLSTSYKSDVGNKLTTQSAVLHCFKCWRRIKPEEVTFQALIDIAHTLTREDIVRDIKEYFNDKYCSVTDP